MKSLFFAIVLATLVSGCSVFRLPESMGYGVMNSDDLATVRDGLPTYLLMLDGALINYPENKGLLQTASTLNSSYAGVFVDDPARRQAMIKKSLVLAEKAMCLHNRKACDLRSIKFEPFEQIIDDMDRKKDIEPLYTLGSAWASYVQEYSDDWNAIADLAKVQRIMEQVVELDEGHETGQALLYLGVLNSLIPPSLGGKPDIAEGYFERALEVSDGQNLMVHVMYAQQYARLMFDQELHDRLLNEAMAADPHVHGLTLQNVFAQQEAERLLADSNDYF